jgi:hypothetical protein
VILRISYKINPFGINNLCKALKNVVIRNKKKKIFLEQTEGKLMIRQTCRMKGHAAQ